MSWFQHDEKRVKYEAVKVFSSWIVDYSQKILDASEDSYKWLTSHIYPRSHLLSICLLLTQMARYLHNIMFLTPILFKWCHAEWFGNFSFGGYSSDGGFPFLLFLFVMHFQIGRSFTLCICVLIHSVFSECNIHCG